MLAVQPKPDGLNAVDRDLEHIARFMAPSTNTGPLTGLIWSKAMLGDVGDDGALGCELAARRIMTFELERRAGRHPLDRGKAELSQPKWLWTL
ncbi:MAG: hypothetical protein ACWGHV_12820 [Stutzerimonas stutzeri]